MLRRRAVMFGVTGAIAALLMLVPPPDAPPLRLVSDTVADTVASAPPRPSSHVGPVRVLVLDFDPIIPDSGGQRAHEAFGWNAPRTLAAGYMGDVLEASGHMVYMIVEWRTIDEFPPKRDGFRYTPATYAACLADNRQCHDPDGLDYEGVLTRYDVAALIDREVVDEVWFFGGPYFGYFESAMAGPGAFEINGEAFTRVPTERVFAIMGFNSERGVAEMLHSLCHRTEATMARVYGGWQAESLTTAWARFAANAHQSGGHAGVGSCHYPPNATSDYDYANPRGVASDADDWLHYPNLTGTRYRVTAEDWGGPDYHRQYMRWWFRHLPGAAGTNPDGHLNDWWRYVFEFNELIIRNAPGR